MKKFALTTILATSILGLTACGAAPIDSIEDADMLSLYKLMSKDSYDLSSKLSDGCPEQSEVVYYSPEERYKVPQTAFVATSSAAYSEEGQVDSLYVNLSDYEVTDATDPFATEATAGNHILTLEFHTENDDVAIEAGTYDVADESSPFRSQYRIGHEGDKTYVLSGSQIASEITFLDESTVCGVVEGKDEFGGLVKAVFKADR